MYNKGCTRSLTAGTKILFFMEDKWKFKNKKTSVALKSLSLSESISSQKSHTSLNSTQIAKLAVM